MSDTARAERIAELRAEHQLTDEEVARLETAPPKFLESAVTALLRRRHEPPQPELREVSPAQIEVLRGIAKVRPIADDVLPYLDAAIRWMHAGKSTHCILSEDLRVRGDNGVVQVLERIEGAEYGDFGFSDATSWKVSTIGPEMVRSLTEEAA